MDSFPFKVVKHVLSCQQIRGYSQATTHANSPSNLVVKQYVPLDNPNPRPGDVTIIATHGSGLPKVCQAFSNFGIFIRFLISRVDFVLGTIRAFVGRNTPQFAQE
jgi:hypothetical protein